MLTVAKVTSGAAKGYAAYLDARTVEPSLGDYYLKDGDRIEAPGRWISGAQAVGADPLQPVEGEQLRALMAVKNPATGLPLRRVGGNGQAVAAIGLAFSAPKSVSAVWALGSPELRAAIEQAHEHAIDRALAYAIERVQMIRERVDKQTVRHRTAADLIATSWRHTTARAVEHQVPDPQLHSHVLLHGAVRSDGKTMAIDSRSWLVHQREVGAAYRTQLASELTRLGFEIQRGTGIGGRYFEIAGIPAGLIDRWSSRHHQVQLAVEARKADKQAALQAAIDAGGPSAPAAASSLAALQRSGRLMPAEERYLAASTRAPKTGLQTHGDLDQHWYQTARSFGFDSLQVERMRTADRRLQAATSEQLLQRLTEFDSTFSLREARAVALEANAGVDIDQALQGLEQLLASRQLLALKDGRYTTAPHRAQERQTVAIAARLARSRVHPLPTDDVQHQALALDAELKAHGHQLSPEQHQALQLACSDRRLVIIEGQAGSGKSTTLTAIARAHQTNDRQLIVTSTAALAAQHLATELNAAGVDARAYSTVALQAALNTGSLKLGPRSTVIHDEAALASTREQRQLLDAVQQTGARLIMVGDPRQNQAVGAGGLWQDLEQAARDNGAHVQLTQIVRAQDPADRRDQTLFRAGQHQRALQGYAARDRVHLTGDQQHAEDAALDAAHNDHRAGKRTLVIAQTSNEHLDELNARAQAIRYQDGQLGEGALPVTGRPYGLRAGDHVQLRHPLDHDQLGRLPNGTSGLVIDVDAAHRHATLRLSDGRQARFTQAQADEASVRLAYVQHPFPAQGQTTDTTHLIVLEHTTQEGSYVALTRARHQTHIHASHQEPEQYQQLELGQPPDQDPLDLLAQRMSRTEPEIASIHTPIAHEHHLAHQHAHEHTTGEQQRQQPDDQHEREVERQLTERLEQALAALKHAQQVIAGYPIDHQRQHAYLIQEAEQVAQAQADEQRSAKRLEQKLDQLGLFARRGQHARELKQRLGWAKQTTECLGDDHQQLRQHADHHQAILEQWTAQHPDARQQLKATQRQFEQLAEQAAHHRTKHPGPHLTRALGPPPPATDPRHRTWQHGALQIERYRAQYEINPTEPTPLGPPPDPDQHQQRQDRELIQSQTFYIRHQLTQPPIQQALARPLQPSPNPQSIQDTPYLTPRPPGLHHVPGRHQGPSLHL